MPSGPLSADATVCRAATVSPLRGASAARSLSVQLGSSYGGAVSRKMMSTVSSGGSATGRRDGIRRSCRRGRGAAATMRLLRGSTCAGVGTAWLGAGSTSSWAEDVAEATTGEGVGIRCPGAARVCRTMPVAAAATTIAANANPQRRPTPSGGFPCASASIRSIAPSTSRAGARTAGDAFASSRRRLSIRRCVRSSAAHRGQPAACSSSRRTRSSGRCPAMWSARARTNARQFICAQAPIASPRSDVRRQHLRKPPPRVVKPGRDRSHGHAEDLGRLVL